MSKIRILLKSIPLVLSLSFLHQATAKQTNTVAAIDSANQRAILIYINEYRHKRGLGPLRMNYLMSEEAAKHSRDMARHAVPFSHQHFANRINRLFRQIKQCEGGAENIAYNYKNAQDVVRNWLASYGHRRNIEGNYNLTGIGLARDRRGKIYYTQIFLRTNNPVYLKKG
jgi:uncharacterized protein YkwD